MSDQPVVYYCWRCENVNTAPCRSDDVPLLVVGPNADELMQHLNMLGAEGDEF